MLEKLSLKHLTWQKMALRICKDKYLADDIVSDMYIKLSDCQKEINDFYVYFTIKSCFIDWLRNEKKIESTELIDNFTEIEEEKINLKVPDVLTFSEKEILRLRQDFSCRKLSEAYNIDKTKIFRIEKKAKEKIEIWKKQNYFQVG
jgi:DNA-directed RNA polymerase specialized sigma24 family protein